MGHFEESSEKILPLNLQLTKLRVIFVYGSNLTHYTYRDGTDFYLKGNFWIFDLMTFFFMITLYFLRRHTNARNEISLCYLESNALFLGGGGVNAQSKLEKLFFAIAMTASFFIVSTAMATFSMHSMVPNKFNKIDSFAQLAQMNTTFHTTLNENKEHINEMLK